MPVGLRCEIDILIGTEFAQKEITLPMAVVFQNGGEGQNVTFQAVGDRSLMTLHNWNNPLGTALNSPYELGQVEDYGIIEMLMVNYCVGVTNHLTIQLWWKDLK
ncbi:hypothetical protein MXF29_24225 [Pseudomonas sp. NC26]|uniref:hypothetical protein n=1 Tax=Pseudomonas TaxID=286 RepID=UPI0023639D7D|nr:MULTISPECIES: hypothetical protein [Pseudomonas]MDD1989924.1 hypothetical protein [Pseudomonas putida]MEC4878708.1 hypothetical protein [Pseudomonas sp. NC26]HDS1796991.1 hypothetical protein [Pseudomonas putida]